MKSFQMITLKAVSRVSLNSDALAVNSTARNYMSVLLSVGST